MMNIFKKIIIMKSDDVILRYLGMLNDSKFHLLYILHYAELQ